MAGKLKNTAGHTSNILRPKVVDDCQCIAIVRSGEVPRTNSREANRTSWHHSICIGMVFTFLAYGVHLMHAAEAESPFLVQAIELLKTGKIDDAQKLASAKSKEDVDFAAALVVQAHCFTKRHDPVKAIEYLDRAVATSREKAFAAYALVSGPLAPRPDEKFWQFEEIRESIWEDIQKLNDAILDEPTRVDVLLERADEFESLDLEEYEGTFTGQWDHYRFDFAICDATMAINASSERKDLKASLKTRARLWHLRAGISNRSLFIYEAQDLRRLLAFPDPGSSTRLNLATALRNAERFQEALDTFPTDLAGLREGEKQSWKYLRADCLRELGRYEEAIPVYSELIENELAKAESDRNQLQLHFYLFYRAECKGSLNRFHEAIKDLDASLKQAAEYTKDDEFLLMSPWRLKYRVMLRQGKWKEIQAVINGESPESKFPAIARYERGLHFMELERWQEAEADLVFFVHEEDEDYELHQNLAKVYEKLGKPDLAQKHAARAKEIFDSLPEWMH